MNEWIKCSDNLPPRSYVESEEETDLCECFPVLTFLLSLSEHPIIQVGFLEEEILHPFPSILHWKMFSDTDEGCLINDIDPPSHWMPLPKPPEQK